MHPYGYQRIENQTCREGCCRKGNVPWAHARKGVDRAARKRARRAAKAEAASAAKAEAN